MVSYANTRIAQADRHIDQAKGFISRQRELIEKLSRGAMKLTWGNLRIDDRWSVGETARLLKDAQELVGPTCTMPTGGHAAR
jgi:hypothetical protein